MEDKDKDQTSGLGASDQADGATANGNGLPAPVGDQPASPTGSPVGDPPAEQSSEGTTEG